MESQQGFEQGGECQAKAGGKPDKGGEGKGKGKHKPASSGQCDVTTQQNAATRHVKVLEGVCSHLVLLSCLRGVAL